MKDLFVFAADSDALAVVRTILARPADIGIRPITFELDRHTGRDPGMIKDGPELIRMKIRKDDFHRVLLIWDHQGSGRDNKPPGVAVNLIQQRLSFATWTDRSDAIALVPELEEWLWYDPGNVARLLGISVGSLLDLEERFARQQRQSSDVSRVRCPKELFEFVLFQREKRKPLPEHFAKLAGGANLELWRRSPTFSRLTTTLHNWFPR